MLMLMPTAVPNTNQKVPSRYKSKGQNKCSKNKSEYVTTLCMAGVMQLCRNMAHEAAWNVEITLLFLWKFVLLNCRYEYTHRQKEKSEFNFPAR